MSSGEVCASAAPVRKQPAVYILCGLSGVAAFAVAGMTGLPLGAFSASDSVYRLVASTVFVLAGVVGVVWRGWSWYGGFMLAGLVFCWLGDVLGPIDFKVGVASFLLGHVFFIGGFVKRGVSRNRAHRATVFYAATGIGISAWLLPNVPRADLALVLSYMAVISLMGVASLSAELAQARWLVGAGAFFFYVSDIFVARGQYVAHGPLNSILCYPLYYAACIMLALSTAVRTRNAD